MNEVIKKWFDEHGKEVEELALDLWRNPEEAMVEYHACSVMTDFMKKYGFETEVFHCRDKNQPPNTVVATWGTGKPVIGIIGEYDGLPNSGQEAVPYRAPKEGCGHGCGHNLMSPSCGAAAVAIKAAMEAEGLPGTVRFIACPAEETVEGKMHLCRDGVFDGLDCCMAWHPEPVNLEIREQEQQSMTNMIVEFFGKTAHAATDPDKGRSALDACELMNVGVNYLREHVGKDVSMHYSYIAAGEKPNVVPRYAAVHYFLRSKDLKSNHELLARVKKIAEGAALMTETECNVDVKCMVSGCVAICDFNQFFYDSMCKLPPLEYTDEEKAYAKELFSNINGREPEEGEEYLFTKINAPTHIIPQTPGSTDAGYVTHLVPTSRLHGLGMVKGTPMHSWGAVAAVGHSVGTKAAIYAAMAQAQCGYDIAKNPSVISGWWDELREKTKGDDIPPIFPKRLD